MRPSTPFTLGPPFHARALTVDQLESYSRPLLLHTALKSKCFPSAKDLNQLESAPPPSPHTLIFKIQGFKFTVFLFCFLVLHSWPCKPSPNHIHAHILTMFLDTVNELQRCSSQSEVLTNNNESNHSIKHATCAPQQLFQMF